MCSFDAATVHSMISSEPHLLASRPARLLANKDILQQQMSLDADEMQRFTRKAHR
jgi:hypothetical protein